MTRVNVQFMQSMLICFGAAVSFLAISSVKFR
jgi:hypothetical protein